jgi:tetratricopeptide (TPR) repeat protein
MKRIILTGLLAAIAGATTLMAQKPPQPKSKGEVEALQAMFNAQDPDSRIKAADALITKYADTDFKDLALYMAAFSYQQKGDAEKAIVYAERTLEANPKHYQAMLMLSEMTTQRTGEHDLDREEKLTRSTKYANDAIAAIKDAAKPNPSLTDEQWTAAKKDLTAQADQALGMVAMARKKYDDAISQFKQAADTASAPEPAYQVRLAQAYLLSGKNDDAIATAQKVMDTPNVHPQVKQVAQAIRAQATQAKNKANGPAAPAAAPAPPQVEIQKP